MHRPPYILSASTNLLGICFIIITGLKLVNANIRSYADEVAWLAALLCRSRRRWHSLRSALSLREASHSCTQAGAAAPANKAGSEARISISARPCLHGNLRLGQLHLNAGSLVSTRVRYGSFPLP